LTHCQVYCLHLQAETAARILRVYRESLNPQTAGAYKSGLAAYEVRVEAYNRQRPAEVCAMAPWRYSPARASHLWL